MSDKKILFALPTPETDPIKMIITTFYKVVDGLPMFLDKSVIHNKDEKDMILEWLNLIRNKKTSVIMAWYLFGFEYTYLEERAKQLGILDTFSKLATVKYKYDGKMKERKQDRHGSRVWLQKYDPSNIILIDIMPYVQSVSGVLGKMCKLVEHYNLEMPQFSGYFDSSDKELEEYSLKLSMVQVELFFKAYQQIVTSKKGKDGLEEMQQFIEDNKKYIEDNDPVFFNTKAYIRNSVKAQLAELSDEQKNEFSL
jgi:DNA polymerase elongation subunit (family B)